MIAPPRPVAMGLAAFVAGFAAQRFWELRRSARNRRWIEERGGIESGRGHFPLFVALHAAFPLALLAEVVFGGSRPGRWWPAWLALCALAQGLRWWAIRSLGHRWNVRIWVLPGMAPVRDGPYRWLRHPNYLAVILELVSIPMIFGAWRTATAASVVNAVALAIRIPAENRALREAPARATELDRRGATDVV